LEVNALFPSALNKFPELAITCTFPFLTTRQSLCHWIQR